MSRIPLEDIGQLTSVRMDTIKRGQDYNFAQITLKDSSTPVLRLPCVVAWEEFKAAVRAAQEVVLREIYSTGAAAGPMPTSVQPLVHQQPYAAHPLVHQQPYAAHPMAALTPSAPPAQRAPTNDAPPSYSSIAGGVSSDGAGAAAIAVTAEDATVVRTFVVSNSDPSRVVPIKIFGNGPRAFARYQADVRRRLDIPEHVHIRLYLAQGVEVTEAEDLVNDDRLLVCVGEEKPRLAILEKKA